MKRVKILDQKALDRSIRRLSRQILERHKEAKNLCFIGIQRRGVYLAQRIKHLVEKKAKVMIPLGVLDITLYRDDLTLRSITPIIQKTSIDFDINKKVIILVDDVLFTGRTVRAALDEIIDFGRPMCIQLAVLIDRGNREFPISADFVGRVIQTTTKDNVEVSIKEIDNKDQVVIVRKR